MPKIGRFTRLDIRPGKEKEVETFLRNAKAQIDEESRTEVWFAVKIGPSTFGIFDAFADGEGQEVHLAGHVAHALAARSLEWFTHPPVIEKLTVLAAKK
ncbi:MAG TPA: antibiotic biosynthesis monooxygenase [Fimbriiglobus sp.]|jgi:quinol monooxygenase YgiN